MTTEHLEAPRIVNRWILIGLFAVILVAAAAAMVFLQTGTDDQTPPRHADASFVGGQACWECHEAEYQSWTDSDHDKAMDRATEESVLGDFDDATFTYRGVTSRFYRKDGGFFVFTEGPDGEMAEFEIAYTFGHEPLQQYLIEFPGGRLQALNITWDVERGLWFRQYPDQDIPPDDWLHWTRGAQNWNGMCAECHSTNLQKGYVPASDTFHTTWTDIDVNCEACHGPGSNHVAWAEIPEEDRPVSASLGLEVSTSAIPPERLVEMCAPCHARRSELTDYDHSRAELLDFMLPSLLEEGLYHPDGQILDEVYVYGSFLQSKMYARGVSCRDCHNSHSLELVREGNQLCTGCHPSARYDSPDHHFHEKIVDGVESEGAQCKSCHMMEQPYMVIDWRADHSFRVPRPDLTARIGTPNACQQSGCHADKPVKWAVDAVSNWYGDEREPHFGTTFAAARAGDPETVPALAELVAGDSTSPIVRATAIQLLARVPGDRTTAVVRSAMESNEPLERQAAAFNAQLLSEEDIDYLAPLLADPVKAVRLAAVSRLAGVPRELMAPHRRTDFDNAMAEYREAMTYTLDFASSAFNLGNIEASLGNTDQAKSYYRQALKVDDGFAPAKMNLSVMLSREGRNQEAEVLLRSVLDDYPNHADAQYSLGLLLVEMGRPQEAVGLLEQVTEAYPRDPRAHYNLGLLLQRLGRSAEAGQHLEEAMRLEPDGLSYIHAYADFLYKTGRPDEALVLADRLIALFPDQPLGRQLKAAILNSQNAR